MKVRYFVLLILLLALAINSVAIIVVSSGNLQKIGKVASDKNFEALTDDAGDNLKNIALGIRESLDSQMQNQYTLVQSWARDPLLIETAATAQSHTLEELYEAWSAEATRVYDEGEATGDGNAVNDINPATSRHLAQLSDFMGTYPEIFITDNRGYAIAANGATGDFDQGPDDWRIFLEGGAPVFKRHKPAEGGEGWYRDANELGLFVGEVEWDNSASTWGIDIVSQIKNLQTDRYLGQIKAVFDYGTFVKDFVSPDEFDVYEIKVINQNGVIVASSEEDQSKISNEEVTVTDLEFFKEVQQGKTQGAIFETDEDGEQVYMGYAVSNDVNKHIVVVSNKEAVVLAPIQSFIGRLDQAIIDAESGIRTSILATAAVVIIVMLLLSFVLIDMLITKPIGQLTRVAQQVSEGNLKAAFPKKIHSEEVLHLSSAMELLVKGFENLKKKK